MEKHDSLLEKIAEKLYEQYMGMKPLKPLWQASDNMKSEFYCRADAVMSLIAADGYVKPPDVEWFFTNIGRILKACYGNAHADYKTRNIVEGLLSALEDETNKVEPEKDKVLVCHCTCHSMGLNEECPCCSCGGEK